MRPFAFFALALLLVPIQSALLHWLGGGAFALALPLPIVVYLGLRSGNVEGAVGSAMVGYVLDLSAGGPKGLLTSLAVALFLFSRFAGSAVDVHGRAGFAVLTGVGSFLFSVGALALLDVSAAPQSPPAMSLLGRVGVEALLTALTSPFLLALFRRIDAVFVREDPGVLQ